MRIASWNCNGGLRNKLVAADHLDADILIVQECENPEKSTQSYQKWAGSYLWIGDNKNKGIGVFCKPEHKIELLDWDSTYRISGIQSSSPSLSWHTNDLKLFLPFKVNNEINILAAWTKGGNNQAFGYIGQLWKYLQANRDKLTQPKTMIIGDLNSNAIWDKADRWWNHSDVMNELNTYKIYSCYHRQTNEPQGKETQATFYLHRKANKAYHIDYALCSSDLLKQYTMTIGKHNYWIDYSDHMPITLDVTLS